MSRLLRDRAASMRRLAAAAMAAAVEPTALPTAVMLLGKWREAPSCMLGLLLKDAECEGVRCMAAEFVARGLRVSTANMKRELAAAGSAEGTRKAEGRSYTFWLCGLRVCCLY